MVLSKTIKRYWLPVLVHVGALLPLALLIRDYSQDAFIIDPVKEITTRTARAALVLLFLSLACSPVNTLFGFRQALRVRRALGLYAFMYAGLHFLTFIGLDYAFEFSLIGPAIIDQRFVLVGFAAFLLLISLAITSTRGWQRRLRKNWKRLHRFVYLAAILVVVHFLWAVKDAREPLRYAAVLAVLLAFRLPWVRRAAGRVRHRLRLGRFLVPLKAIVGQ